MHFQIPIHGFSLIFFLETPVSLLVSQLDPVQYHKPETEQEHKERVNGVEHEFVPPAPDRNEIQKIGQNIPMSMIPYPILIVLFELDFPVGVLFKGCSRFRPQEPEDPSAKHCVGTAGNQKTDESA